MVYSDVFRVGRRQASPRTAVRAHSAMDRDTVRWHNLVRTVLRCLALQRLARFSGVLLRWLVRQRALATADGSTAAVSASTPGSAADLLGKAIYHRSRWFVGVAKTAFGFVLTGARWAMGTYVEVGEDKAVKVNGAGPAVRARVERTQSVSAASASTLGMRASSQPMPQHASAGSSSCKQLFQAAHGQQEKETDVQAAYLADDLVHRKQHPTSTRRPE